MREKDVVLSSSPAHLPSLGGTRRPRTTCGSSPGGLQIQFAGDQQIQFNLLIAGVQEINIGRQLQIQFAGD